MSSEKHHRRIALIGPLLPFRGGIAQHTTMLHRELQQHTELMTVSFSRQYPEWLFPGDTDRDPAYDAYKEDGVDYNIDSINPLTWRAVVKQIVAFDAQTVIIPCGPFSGHPVLVTLHGRCAAKVLRSCFSVHTSFSTGLYPETMTWVKIDVVWTCALTNTYNIRFEKTLNSLVY